MQQNNTVTEFVLFGLTQDPKRQKMVFLIFSVFYVGTIVGNMLIIMTIKFSRTLGSPMYFFLFYLSLVDACFSTTTAPRLLVDALSTKKIISYNECMTQIFALHLFGCMEIFVLILMAIDRYVAICKPLHYPIIMRRQCVDERVKYGGNHGVKQSKYLVIIDRISHGNIGEDEGQEEHEHYGDV
ncbi:Olfactory receptor 4C11 [Tupaia chinensis]|uniref:Olfactory receptor 4C11 n=1 Tax=Tupaia chinensis TaxID=246437 RepID=L9JDU3_TUPCH|nr:Olfactory receptor 4C11 [Tupaia chinensis]